MKRKFRFLFVTAVFLIPNFAHAAPIVPNILRYDAGIYTGFGTQRSESGTIPSTPMADAGVYFSPQWRIKKKFGIGAYFEYTKAWQLKEKENSVMQNLSGHGYLFGPAVAGKVKLMHFLFAYALFGQFKYDRETYNGEESILEKPRGPHISFGYYIDPAVTADLSYSGVAYQQNQIGESDTSELNRRKTTDFRLGLSLHF